MVDIVDVETRSRMMSGIRGKNTKPELIVRKYLHACGYRFRLHRKDLPGKPDLVLPKYNLAIFVHGCFWHRHSGCFYATSPSTRSEFWEKKLGGNVLRDELHVMQLRAIGWRVLIIWECGLRLELEKIKELNVLISSEDVFCIWPARPSRMR